MLSSDAEKGRREAVSGISQIDNYIQAVCEQIRWKKARHLATKEIRNHLCDQRDAYLASGMNEDEAVQKAVESMGDPVAVGTSLDRVHRPRPQYFMIVVASVMLTAGVVMRHLTGEVVDDVSGYSMKSNLLGAFFAWGVFLSVYFSDFSRLKKHAGKIFSTAVIFAAVLKFSDICYWQAKYGWGLGILWEHIFGYPFLEGFRQCLPLLYPAVLALVVYRMRGKGFRGILKCEAICLLMICSLDLETSGMFLLFAAAAVCTLCYAVWQGWFRVGRCMGMAAAALPFLAGSGGLVFWMRSVPTENIEALGGAFSVPNLFFSGGPFFGSDDLKAEAMKAMLSGSVFSGRGSLSAEASHFLGAESFGNGKMLTTLTYHYGWIAFFAAAALLILFIAAGIYLCRKQKSPFVRLLSVSVLATLAMQTILYLLTNLGVGFSMSAVLPLMSGGAVMLMADAALIGFLLSMFRTEELYGAFLTE